MKSDIFSLEKREAERIDEMRYRLLAGLDRDEAVENIRHPRRFNDLVKASIKHQDYYVVACRWLEWLQRMSRRGLLWIDSEEDNTAFIPKALRVAIAAATKIEQMTFC
jgi:hypothetical protein